jgi:zinc protease
MKQTLQNFLALCIALSLHFSVHAQAAVSPTQQASQAQQFTLPNGLTLIVKPDRRAPTAVHMLWVRVGAMDEVDGTTGVAHVLEHMLFKGTAKLAVGEFSRRVAALGGRENAFTARDYTGYFQQIPAGKLEDVIALEADRFANNRWSDAEFKKEIEVVKEERRLRTEDNPRSLMWEALNAQVFTASPYRRPIVGWMSDLDAMTPDDARNFYRQWYTPANAAVSRSITAPSPAALCRHASRVMNPHKVASAVWNLKPLPSKPMWPWLLNHRKSAPLWAPTLLQQMHTP